MSTVNVVTCSVELVNYICLSFISMELVGSLSVARIATPALRCRISCGIRLTIHYCGYRMFKQLSPPLSTYQFTPIKPEMQTDLINSARKNGLAMLEIK